MLRHQTLKLLASIVKRVPVIWRLPRAQGIAILPVQVARHARRVQGRRLPRLLDGAVVRCHAVFFKKTRLSCGLAGCAVRGHPEVAPVVVRAPCFVS